MVRPIIYKTLTRVLIGLIVALLWNRINNDGYFSMFEHAFFIMGMFWACMAWFNYLKLDGMKLHYLGEEGREQRRQERLEKRRARHKTREMADFLEEEPTYSDSLERTEKTAASLAANLLAGFCLIIPSVIAMVLPA